jgi:uncharacterized membrane protein
MMYGFGGHAGLVWLVLVLVLMLCAGGATALVYALRPQRPAPDDPDVNAHRILDMRLAGGEIDVEEYRRIQLELQRGDSGD